MFEMIGPQGGCSFTNTAQEIVLIVVDGLQDKLHTAVAGILVQGAHGFSKQVIDCLRGFGIGNIAPNTTNDYHAVKPAGNVHKHM